MIGTVLTILAPTLICVALGFGWARLKQSYDTRLIARLITLVGGPCLIFTTLLRTTVDLAALGEVALIALIALAIFALTALAILRATRLSIPAYLPPLTFHNAGNLGLPISLFAFGETGLAIAIAYFTVTATLNYTLGTWFYSGRASPVDALKTPLPYAVAIAVPLLLLDARPPEWLLNTTGLLGQMTIPLMLFTLGVSLTRLKLTNLPRHTVLAALRLGLGFGVGFGLAELFGLEGVARGVVILQASMPVAVFNYLLAQHFDRYSDEAASIVLTSTLLAVISLPLILWYLL
jgi:predicted permease